MRVLLFKSPLVKWWAIESLWMMAIFVEYSPTELATKALFFISETQSEKNSFCL